MLGGPERHFGRKLALRITFSIVTASLFLALAVRLSPSPLPPPQALPDSSLLVTDREGRALREVLSAADTRSRWIPLGRISPHVIHAFVAAEDRRFYFHPGIDPVAIARAAILDIRRGRVVSGGSTLTQQLARTLRADVGSRSLIRKVAEAWTALRLEAHLSKPEILEQYLNRIPFGNQLYGIEAASRIYLRRSPASLTPAEAAFLAVIPRAPSAYNPRRNLARVLELRQHVLGQMRARGYLAEDEYRRALAEPCNSLDPAVVFRAPHFVEHLVASGRFAGRIGEVQTTLDLPLQSAVEEALQATVRRLAKSGVTNAAVVVLDNPTREVLAWAGSRDFFDPEGGQVDGVLALRQPGSTMKPFTYALGIEHGLTAASILPDLPVHFPTVGGAAYAPTDYDRGFRGPVRLRIALGNSLNVPAVMTANGLDLNELLDRLHMLGFASLARDAAFYGLGLTLGNGEVALLELANAYATLASGGEWRPVRFVLNEPALRGTRVFDEKIAYLVTDILADDSARALTFGEGSVLALPFACAVKTGTSKNFRDNWTVGFTPEVTAAVWVGNFEGEPMHSVSGVTGAGPLWNLVLQEAMKGRPRQSFPRPDGIVETKVCPLSGALAGPGCPSAIEERFIRGSEPRSSCSMHRIIPVDGATGAPIPEGCRAEQTVYRVFEVYPEEYEEWARKAGRPVLAARLRGGSTGPCRAERAEVEPANPATEESSLRIRNPIAGQILAYDPGIPPELQNLELKALAPSGTAEITWSVDGVELPSRSARALWPLSRGEHRIAVAAVIAGRAKRDEVRIVVR